MPITVTTTHYSLGKSCTSSSGSQQSPGHVCCAINACAPTTSCCMNCQVQAARGATNSTS